MEVPEKEDRSVQSPVIAPSAESALHLLAGFPWRT
jgi:hypothetical protein